ncbi:fluoride efflux transporter FluC [Halomonas sp. 328]|uniref:fluoride efflux transporter FluC n=1 Tax=Halomonas sp. 328 TaxID=2776704 RepID=UPI0018A7E087|nr:CrcB family protein [Halomonas sp. 328]MBF8223740.1 CrcB family protein [Halomonas sp. 328]
MSIAQGMVLVVLGGALGGMGRVWLGQWVGRRAPSDFPWGTLAVNLLGALALGVIAARGVMPGAFWALAAVGLLGSFTTVSSFAYQTLTLLRGPRPALGWLNLALTLGLGLAAMALGHGLGGVL